MNSFEAIRKINQFIFYNPYSKKMLKARIKSPRLPLPIIRIRNVPETAISNTIKAKQKCI